MEILPNFDLETGASLSAQFIVHGKRDYHAAARYVQCLPYGRNSERSDYGLVLAEGRGTCSTKHALLAALAREHDSPVELRLGIYEMDGKDTPGVGPVLCRHGIDGVPEAHCYLAYRGSRVDLTRTESTEPVEEFLHEETIEPEGIGAHKVDTHRRFVREWASQRNLDFEEVWRIREECILALSERDSI
ncbi:MAG TPA: hypothetical protein VFI90_03680 [Rubrobacter sp.]|nr:hypothetical protein [Rubrobacter sp.]